MVALAGIRRVFHLAQQRVHFLRPQPVGRSAPSRGRPWSRRHASAGVPAAAPRPIPPCVRRDRAAATPHWSCRAATAFRAPRWRRGRTSRWRGRTSPVPRRGRPVSRRWPRRVSTISGISRICRCTPLRGERRLQPLIDDALMRGVLVDHDHAVAGLRDDVVLVHLRARRAERPVDQVGLRRFLETHIGGGRADIERGLAAFGKAPPSRRSPASRSTG